MTINRGGRRTRQGKAQEVDIITEEPENLKTAPISMEDVPKTQNKEWLQVNLAEEGEGSADIHQQQPL